MKILELNQQATVSRQVDSIIGWEDEVVYDPIFVFAEHIESFSFAGLTRIKMASGDSFSVKETPEEIFEMLGSSPSKDSLKIWEMLGKES